jgi:acyl carrier protein
MVTQDPDRTERAFRGWLINRLSMYLRRAEADIGTEVPFAEYGLDSVAALSLFGDIEDEFGFYLEPTVAWDHPTVSALARFLAAESARTGASVPGGPLGGGVL